MVGGMLKSASSVALFAALGLVAVAGVSPAAKAADLGGDCLLYTSPSPRDGLLSRMPSSA